MLIAGRCVAGPIGLRSRVADIAATTARHLDLPSPAFGTAF
jgi:phosphopentomutase